MKIQRRYTISGAVILLVILLLPLINATAQSGGPLNYGSSVTGAITAETPLALYTFNGTQGDLVSINVYGQPGGLLPTFDLVGPAQQALASSQPDTFAANLQAPIGGETSLAILLPTTGAYSLLVAGNNGTLGDFILQLQGRSPVNAVPLTLDQAITATVQTNAPPQWYSFSAGECPTMLTAFNPSTGTPYTFPYIVKVRDEHGTTLANWRGGESVEDQVTVQPLTGPYEVEVWADDATQSGSIALLITCADAAEECPPTESSTAPDTAAASEAICPTCEPCPVMSRNATFAANFVCRFSALMMVG